MKKIAPLFLVFISFTLIAQKPFVPSDVYKIKSISDPRPSPDGKWWPTYYQLRIRQKDKSDSDIWMIIGTEVKR